MMPGFSKRVVPVWNNFTEESENFAEFTSRSAHIPMPSLCRPTREPFQRGQTRPTPEFSAPLIPRGSFNVRISRTSKEGKDELVGSAIEQNFFSSPSHHREEHSDTG